MEVVWCGGLYLFLRPYDAMEGIVERAWMHSQRVLKRDTNHYLLLPLQVLLGINKKPRITRGFEIPNSTGYYCASTLTYLRFFGPLVSN